MFDLSEAARIDSQVGFDDREVVRKDREVTSHAIPLVHDPRRVIRDEIKDQPWQPEPILD